MNPRDEKILITIRKKQNSDYENLVPFNIIERSFPWVDGTELTIDLLNLADNGYVWKKPIPEEHSGWWFSLTPKGNRECERILYENSETRKNRNIQLISSLVGVIVGFLLGKFF